MDNVFGAQDAVSTSMGASNMTESQKKEKKVLYKKTFAESMAADPTLQNKIGTLSGSIEILNTLGYGKGGNIIVDKSSPEFGKDELDKDGNPVLDKNNKPKKKRPLKETSQIVGYVLKNIGNVAIPYTTEVWKQNKEGVYVGEVVEKQAAPNEVFFLNRKYMTLFASMPEISFEFANGKMTESSRNVEAGNLDETLTAYYFSFSKESKKEVNDDEVKLSVGADRVVKDEYIETFGYLCNAPVAKERAHKEGGTSWSTQAMAANYVRKLIEQNGKV